jgi:hypothetical protein
MAYCDLLHQIFKFVMELYNGFILLFHEVIQPYPQHVGVFLDTPSFEEYFLQPIHGFNSSIKEPIVPTSSAILEGSNGHLILANEP